MLCVCVRACVRMYSYEIQPRSSVKCKIFLDQIKRRRAEFNLQVTFYCFTTHCMFFFHYVIAIIRYFIVSVCVMYEALKGRS